jgi:hypothetical protein
MRLKVLLAGFALSAVACGSTAIAEQPVSSIPNCTELSVAQSLRSGDEKGYATPLEAAEEVRQAIIDGGGRPDGSPVEDLVQLDELRFYLPIPLTPAADGDVLIDVEELSWGGFLAIRVTACPEAIPEPFLWRVG